MSISLEQMRNTSAAFRTALLKSERKRIVGVIVFFAFFSVLQIVRIFVFGSAMSSWGILAAVLMIAFELGLLRAVNEALRSGKDLAKSAWYLSTVVEAFFPALGIVFWASTRLVADYRPLATPWLLAFFPLILLSVLRLAPRLSLLLGVVSATAYLTAAYFSGWRLVPGPNGLTVTQTAVVYFSLVLLITGALASRVAAEIRTHVESALNEAESRHQLQQIEHELQIARSIQQSLLPKIQPQIAGFQVAGWSRSATDTGGDFYDWQKLADGSWVMVLADVTGHGIGPAILASVCRAYSRANFKVRASLETILRSINQSFAEDLTPERFATFVAALCQDDSDEVELLSAGHGPIFVYSAKNRSLSCLDAQALPLGVFPDMWEASPLKLRMGPGDIVVLITDGFFEWENEREEQFGTDRLAAVIQQSCDREPEEIIAELYDSVLKFAHGAPQQDDLTALLIKRSQAAVILPSPEDILRTSAVVV
jgi:serine phosphatase RsbU (regulator of sigma subunit)